MFLYILKFKHGNFLKIGISDKVDHSRIIENSRNLNDSFDLNSSVIVRASRDKTIKVLEKQLLEYTFEYIPDEKLFEGMEGRTEVRTADCYDELIDEINYQINKRKEAGLTIQIGIEIEQKKIFKEKEPLKPKKKEATTPKIVIEDTELSDTIFIHNNLIHAQYKMETIDTKIFYAALRSIKEYDTEFKEVKIHKSEIFPNTSNGGKTYELIKKAATRLKSKEIKIKEINSDKFVTINLMVESSYEDGGGYMLLKFNEAMKSYLLSHSRSGFPSDK